jgi:hypothetical protein
MNILRSNFSDCKYNTFILQTKKIRLFSTDFFSCADLSFAFIPNKDLIRNEHNKLHHPDLPAKEAKKEKKIACFE